MVQDYYLDILCLVVPIVCGFFAFKSLSTFFKILFAQVSFSLVISFISIVQADYLKAFSLPVNSHWMMINIQLLIEMELIFFAVWKFNLSRRLKNLVVIFNTLFIISYLWQTKIQGFYIYLNFADVTACICFTVLFILILFNLFKDTTLGIWNSPKKLTILGLLIYFGCSVPLISMELYLIENYPKIAGKLFVNVNFILAAIRYLFLARAFYIIFKDSKRDFKALPKKY